MMVKLIGSTGHRRRSRLRSHAVLLAVVGLLMTVTAAPALGDDKIVDEVPFDFFYEDAQRQLVFITGPAFEQGCVGEGFTIATRRSVLEDDGTYTSRMRARGVRVALYEGFSSGADLIGAACGAVAQGLEPPQPVAEGVGSWVYWAEGQTALVQSSFDPPLAGTHVRNSAHGFVTYADGSVARVQGNAEWVAVADGELSISTNEVIVRPVR